MNSNIFLVICNRTRNTTSIVLRNLFLFLKYFHKKMYLAKIYFIFDEPFKLSKYIGFSMLNVKVLQLRVCSDMERIGLKIILKSNIKELVIKCYTKSQYLIDNVFIGLCNESFSYSKIKVTLKINTISQLEYIGFMKKSLLCKINLFISELEFKYSVTFSKTLSRLLVKRSLSCLLKGKNKFFNRRKEELTEEHFQF